MITLAEPKFSSIDERKKWVNKIIAWREERGYFTTPQMYKYMTDKIIAGIYSDELAKKEKRVKNQQTKKEHEIKEKYDSLEWAKYLEQVKKNLEKAQEKYGTKRVSQISIDDKIKTKTLNEEQRKLYQEMIDGSFKITDINSKKTQNLTDAEKWEIINRENEEMRKRAQEMLDLDKEVGGRKR